MLNHYDILIIGAGPVGLCCANAAAQAGFQVALLESQPASALEQAAEDGREIALTHRSQRYLQHLGVWSHLPAEQIAPLRAAQVFNGQATHHLNFQAHTAGVDALGYLVANYLLRRAAYISAREQANIHWFTEVSVQDIAIQPNQVQLQLRDGVNLQGTLLIAADSRYSATRRMLGMPADMLDFGKTMLVCRMTHEKAHQQTAWEWFDHGQTLALLPMNPMNDSQTNCHQSSVVVTVTAAQAQQLMRMPITQFNLDIAQRFSRRLGTMQLQGERHAYPLVATYAHRFVQARVALIGDAAVGMHPVTAHGFNLGLRGVDSLLQQLTLAQQTHQDIGSLSILASYQRQHRQDTKPLYLATNAIVRLYTDDRPVADLMRKAALHLAEHFPPFKHSLLSMLTEAKTQQTSTTLPRKIH